MEIVFHNPVYLWILLALPVLVIIHVFALKYSRSSALKFSNFEAIERVSKGEFLGKPYIGLFRSKNIFLLLFRTITYTLLILAITGVTVKYFGFSSDFDFVLAIDSSSSMLADDIYPNRLIAAKNASSVFIENIPPKAKIGVISFAGVPVVELRPVEDKKIVKQVIDNIQVSDIGGTNFGDTILSAANIFDSEKQKVIVFLTDGQSNVGSDIGKALNYANEHDIIINTIGIGTEQGGKFQNLEVLSKLDEETLTNIANNTFGKFFKAENQDAITSAFSEIATARERTISLDISWMLLIAAMILLSLEWLLINTRYRTTPG